MMYDIIIVGAGTAGLSAAIYGVRAGKTVLVLEAETYGGQIMNTPEVENYPGIAKISGFEFASGLYQQAVSLGAKVKYEKVESIVREGQEWEVTTPKEQYSCKAVILATGVKKRKLGLEKEEALIGKGISYCATCDGAFFRGKEVAVAGGGNTALEDALFLSNYCKKVFIIHRRNELRGAKKTEERLREKENVEFLLESRVAALNGTTLLESIEVENIKTKEVKTLQIQGLFVAIGQIPDNQAFAELVELDENGYIRALEDCRTSTDGVFAAGDCRTKTVRQLTTAAADGAVAALAACEL